VHIEAFETERPSSTALVDSDYVIKFHRKLEHGIHPAIEVGQYLTDLADFANAPALLGSVELVDGNNRSAIATVHAYVPNQGDGWAVSAAYLDRFVDRQRLLPDGENPSNSEEQALYARFMSQAGRRTAELHLALASNSDIADFAPEPMRPKDVQRWIGDVTALASRVMNSLSQRRDMIREPSRRLFDRVMELRDTLPDRLRALMSPVGLNIRLHGDLRLDELLIVKDDIFIIGFEGKSARSLTERRRKAPPARDVAGLIRSIDYSVDAALDRALNVAPDEPRNRLAVALARWRELSTAAYLAGYREATSARLWPADPHVAHAVLDFFLLEKIFYEIEDELVHRPELLRVPLAAMLRILSAPASES
jgi:maltose alpha-D-glucosyltransferase/alpha-amylase